MDLQKRIDQYLSALTRLKKFNGCVYICNQDQDVLKKAYNLSTNPHSSLRVDNTSQFDIHSVSKLMAYGILVKMQEEHKIKLTDTLSKYLPHFSNSNQITINQLLHHSSGLPRELTKKPEHALSLSPDEIIAAASEEKLEFAPGTSTLYSNVGYEVVYYLIGKLTGKSFVQCVKEYIFDPLHMNASGAHFFIRHANLKHPAQNHQLQNRKITRIPNITPDEFPTARIYSTTGDLMLYLRSLQDEPFRSALSDSLRVIQKNGGADGIRAQIYTHTQLNYSFVLLSNYDEIPFQQTINDLVNIIEGKPYQFPVEINRKAPPVPVAVLKRYTGTYDFAEANHTKLEFRVEGIKLTLFKDGKKLTDLFSENETMFFEDAKSAECFEFKPNGSSWEIIWTYQGVKFRGEKIRI
ncbi:hypothetical protein GCM10027037_23550 [Mucilaginibacter koreensis]